jgi:flagellar motor switch protein FliG
MWPFDNLHRRVNHFKNRPLRGNEKVAIMLLSVSPRLAANVYKHLSPEQIRELNTQMSKMVYLEDSQRIEIICKHMGIDLTPDLKAREDLLSVVIAALEAYIRTNSKKAAHSFEILLDNWPRSPGKTEGLKVPHLNDAAVLLMSLTPETSALLFSKLGPVTVQKICSQITQLPFVTAQRRSQVIRHFLEIEGHDISAEGLQTALEALVSQNPSRSAERLVEVWPGIG